MQSDNQQPIQCDERGAVHAACVSLPPYKRPQNLDLQVMHWSSLLEVVPVQHCCRWFIGMYKGNHVLEVYRGYICW